MNNIIKTKKMMISTFQIIKVIPSAKINTKGDLIIEKMIIRIIKYKSLN